MKTKTRQPENMIRIFSIDDEEYLIKWMDRSRFMQRSIRRFKRDKGSAERETLQTLYDEVEFRYLSILSVKRELRL
jgi:hypothetical protein